MRTIHGRCSCGAIEFRFSAEALRAYQCHCSICRRATGSAFSTTLMVPEQAFSWTRGLEGISSYAKPSGYQVNFCAHCGSPVPNRFRGSPWLSVPAGCLDDAPDMQVVAQLHLGSRAPWDKDHLEGVRFEEMPGVDAMLGLLGLVARP